METVGSAIGSTSDGGDTLLDFLTVLPEEVIEGRRINLSVCSTAQPFTFENLAASVSPMISI